jgi:hypothetical protein
MNDEAEKTRNGTKAANGNDAGFIHRNDEFLQGQRSHGTARTDSPVRVPAGLRCSSLLYLIAPTSL